MSWFLPDLNEGFILTSAFLIGAGWYAIRHKQIRWHRRLMFWGSVAASLFFLSYVFKTVVLGDTSFGGPRRILPVYTAFWTYIRRLRPSWPFSGSSPGGGPCGGASRYTERSRPGRRAAGW